MKTSPGIGTTGETPVVVESGHTIKFPRGVHQRAVIRQETFARRLRRKAR